MKTLKLSQDLSFPIDAITQTFLIVGKRGSGKSNTAARLVEQFHAAKLPFVVLDPVDTWYGIRSSRDGSGPGLENVYVFGGRKQDLPLEASAGALIAEVLCEHRISMVLSVKHLSGRERSGFMVDFAKTLFQKWAGGPLHLVLEEAHELAPQSIPKNERAEEMLGAFKRLWKLGRASGIGGSAVTQRPASLSKDITTQSEILIAHRTIGPQDVKAVGEWVKYRGEHEQILGDLPTLPTGQAFVWSPEFPSDKPLGLKRATILLRDTYDSASTPKVGEQRVEPKELADVDLERLRTKMAKTIERAKADDPRELKKALAEKDKRVKELEQNLARGANAISSPAKPAPPALTDADRALIEKLAATLDLTQRELTGQLAENDVHTESMLKVSLDRHSESTAHIIAIASGKVEKALEKASVKKLLEKLNGLASAAPVPMATMHVARHAPQATRQALEQVARHVAKPAPRPQLPVQVDGDSKLVDAGGNLKKHVRAILTAFAQHPDGLTRQQSLIHAGYQPSGDISTAFAEMMARTWLGDGLGGRLFILAAGLEALGSYDPLPVGQALRHSLVTGGSGKLSKVERQLLQVWFDQYPKAMARKDAIATAGYKPSGDISTAIAKFIRLDWLVENHDGIQAADLFFEE